jgi:hypothetical protein
VSTSKTWGPNERVVQGIARPALRRLEAINAAHRLEGPDDPGLIIFNVDLIKFL